PLFGALVLLMGVAPLFAWRKQAARKLGKTLLIPFVASIVLAFVWGYTHRMHPGSYFALWLVTFVMLAILLEFWKGISARVKSRGESAFTALIKLISRNHRRYGGYIIHLGVVMIALGFIGDYYFKEETQGTVSVGETL
ncbi:MAG: hypothetical protein GTN46_04945, partial [Gammaproteobacteria bacterium]|nr:hypothetical protein [Gammaproteobacteria bacterium]